MYCNSRDPSGGKCDNAYGEPVHKVHSVSLRSVHIESEPISSRAVCARHGGQRA